MKTQRKKYQIVALGGTFDHFHDGHKAFIDAAAKMGERLLIGIATKKLLQGKTHSAAIETLKARFRSVAHYCKTNGYSVQLLELNDIYGPTVDESEFIDALFVTTETVGGAKKIATIREQLHLKTLPVHIVDLVAAQDGAPIHSSRIRSGEISRSGVVYAQLLDDDCVLSDSARSTFSKVQGSLIFEPTTVPAQKIVVGDLTLEQFITEGWDYSLGIFDGYSERAVFTSTALSALKPNYTTGNTAGSISASAVQTLKKALQKNTTSHIKVTGEEDLLAVAAVLLAPLGSIIYYGQPGQGIVEVVATEKNKNHFFATLAQK